MDDAGDLERTYRREATRIRAALAARIGDVGLAEEAVQEAFAEALEHWREKGGGEAGGMPPNPGGWRSTGCAGTGPGSRSSRCLPRPSHRRPRTPPRGCLVTGVPGMTRMNCSA